MDTDEKPPSYSEVPAQSTFWLSFANSDNPFIHNGEALARRMGQLSGSLFCTPENMEIELLDVKSGPQSTSILLHRAQSQTVHQTKELDAYLSQKLVGRTKFISMHAAHSNGHLSITPEAMHKLLTAHKVGPHFLDLLLSFAVGAKDTEAGVGSLTYKARPDSSFELQYILRYPEQLPTGEWTISRTALYNMHYPSALAAGKYTSLPSTIWILLHSRPSSTLQTRMNECAQKYDAHGTAKEEWEFVHLLVLGTAGEGWGWFLRSLGEEVEQLDLTAQSHHNATEMLFSLHALQTRFAPLKSMLVSTLATVKALGTVYAILRQKNGLPDSLAGRLLDELKTWEVRVGEWVAVVEGLDGRLGVVRALVRDCRTL